MPYYTVTLYYHTTANVVVEANNEDDAVEEAENCYVDLLGNKVETLLLNNLQSDANLDVEEYTGKIKR
jgi:hypothetical protein